MEKAILTYRMIEEGDRVLVGVSGGADSLSLLKLLHERSDHGTDDYSLVAVHVDLGFRETEPRASEVLASYFQTLGVDYRIVHTDISRDALDPKARKNPCFICSLYRRKRIYETAEEEGCNKIAYGHHKDDIVETLLINILYGRKIETMSPVQTLFRGRMYVIRPLTYVKADRLKKYARESGLPVVPRLCPVDGKTRRQKINDMIDALQRGEENANIRENVFRSLVHVNMDFAPPVTGET